MEWIGKLVPWGPVFFGVLILAPMSAAALDAAGVSALGSATLPALMGVGALWGTVAKIRGRWL